MSFGLSKLIMNNPVCLAFSCIYELGVFQFIKCLSFFYYKGMPRGTFRKGQFLGFWTGEKL